MKKARPACRIRQLSKLQGSVRDVALLFDQEKRGTGVYRTQEEIASPQELAEEEASLLMNQVACGEISTWEEIRPQLADLYRRAGKEDCAKFIETGSA